MKRIVLLLAYTILTGVTIVVAQTEYVIVVTIDGARYSETFGDSTHQYIPKIWNDLRLQGTIFTSFYNDGVTQTNSGHATIVTGTWQAIANDGSERPHMPTIFEYFRKEKSSSVTENFVVLGKSKLNILTYSDHAEYGVNYAASVDTTLFQYDDVHTLAKIKDVITSFHPHLIVTTFSGTDRAGHDGPWSNYIAKLQRADSSVGDLWNFIQADPVYKNKTTLILTNDHGRHTVDYRSHGDGCDGCRHISLMIIGPDTPIGKTVTARYTQADITPTIGTLLKFGPRYSTGSTIAAALTDPTTHTVSLRAGWNLLSVPMRAFTMLKTELFPAAISPAFSYNGSYLNEDTLENGIGYWVKFPLDQHLAIAGYNIDADTFDIIEGWNLIGSLTIPIPVSKISSTPPGITLSEFFGYSTSYFIADTLQPCRGYWVKSNQSGQLFLAPSATASPVSIISDNNTPPLPPDINESSTLPLYCSLEQNYPNPFNPKTKIRFKLPVSSFTLLKVYDFFGREVTTLINKEMEAGEHETEWDAEKLTGGVYFVHLTVRSYVSTVKALLIK